MTPFCAICDMTPFCAKAKDLHKKGSCHRFEQKQKICTKRGYVTYCKEIEITSSIEFGSL